VEFLGKDIVCKQESSSLGMTTVSIHPYANIIENKNISTVVRHHDGVKTPVANDSDTRSSHDCGTNGTV
jgi:hypothetical protein